MLLQRIEPQVVEYYAVIDPKYAVIYIYVVIYPKQDSATDSQLINIEVIFGILYYCFMPYQTQYTWRQRTSLLRKVYWFYMNININIDNNNVVLYQMHRCCNCIKFWQICSFSPTYLIRNMAPPEPENRPLKMGSAMKMRRNTSLMFFFSPDSNKIWWPNMKLKNKTILLKNFFWYWSYFSQ